MTVADYKRKWFLAKRQELRDSGLKDAEIARRCGYKPPYFSQVVNDKVPVGEELIDAMCRKFALKFPGDEFASDATTVTVDAKLFAELVEQVKLQTALLNSLVKDRR